MQPMLDKMKDLLIGKNVASDIAGKLCESVAVKLEGKVINVFLTGSFFREQDKKCLQKVSIILRNRSCF